MRKLIFTLLVLGAVANAECTQKLVCVGMSCTTVLVCGQPQPTPVPPPNIPPPGQLCFPQWVNGQIITVCK